MPVEHSLYGSIPAKKYLYVTCIPPPLPSSSQPLFSPVHDKCSFEPLHHKTHRRRARRSRRGQLAHGLCLDHLHVLVAVDVHASVAPDATSFMYAGVFHPSPGAIDKETKSKKKKQSKPTPNTHTHTPATK